MTNINELQTPSLILDRTRMAQNILTMRDKLVGVPVQLRPHLKTCKSVTIAKQLIAPAEDAKITVSTLTEAEYFFAAGYKDILYAVSIVPTKLDRIFRLQQKGAHVTLLLDNLQAARMTAELAQKHKTSFPCLVEIDSDGKRAGLQPSDPDLITIAKYLNDTVGVSMRGVMTHAGGSYGCKSVAEIEQFAERERLAITSAAEAIRKNGMNCNIVSMGSTPTVTYAKSLEGVTEVRAGVYVFQDMVMHALKVCALSDIALSVLASVISHNKVHNRILIDAGSLALSADPGKPNQHGYVHFGQVCRADNCTAYDDLFVTSCNQEHGLISLTGTKYQFEDFPIGSKLRILPNHACITSAAYDGYHVTDPSGEIHDYWTRCNGWTS